MTKSISDIYGKSFFRKHEPWQDDYVQIANTLCRFVEFASVLDVGCGNAYVIERLRNLNKTVCGIEGSRVALEFMPPSIRDLIVVHDLTTPIGLGHFDLVICTEVAEHLEPVSSDTLVNTVCNHTPISIFFTAATPGQGGHHHRNEQPNRYWIDKFGSCGYMYDRELTMQVRHALQAELQHIAWIGRNAMVFNLQGSRDSHAEQSDQIVQDLP